MLERFNGLLTTLISCFFSKRVKGSVTPLMYGRDAKEFYGLKGSTNLKTIPTNSAGEGDWSHGESGSSCLNIANKLRRIAVGL